MISGPLYLFDSKDAPDEVAKDQLPLLTNTFIDVMRELDKVPAEKIRAKE